MESSYVRCALTALAFDRRTNSILMGQGSHIQEKSLINQEHSRKETNLITTRNECALTPGCVIHGIRLFHHQVHVVFGGRSLRIRGDVEPRYLQFAILDALPTTAQGGTLVALSSGVVARVEPNKDLETLFVPPDTASARQYLAMRFGALKDRSDDAVVVAGGSVMGTLHVWTRRRFRVLQAHKGAVFALRFASRQSHNDCLCTGGEDWTVRLWRRKDPKDLVSYEMEWCGYGSTARVWDCDFWSEGVVSVCEDACVRVWSIKGEMLREIHAVRDIRCCEVHNDLLFAGGDSQKLYMWDLACIGNLPDEPPKQVCQDMVSSRLRSAHSVVTALSSNRDTIVAVTADWECIVYCKIGTIFTVVDVFDLAVAEAIGDGSLSRRNEIIKSVLLILNDEEQGSSSASTISVIIGTSLGRISRISLSPSEQRQQLIWKSANHHREVTVLEKCGRNTLVSCSGDGIVVFSNLLNGSKLFSDTKIPTKRSNPTCACFLPARNEVVLGDSFGNLFVLDVNHGTILRMFKRAHGRLPVTKIRLWGKAGGFISAGRNGMLVFFQDGIHCTGTSSKFGPITQVEDFLFKENDHEGTQPRSDRLIVVGTLGETMFAWDTAEECVVMQISQGGFKRPYQYFGESGLLSAGIGGLVRFPQPPKGRKCGSSWVDGSSSWHGRVCWSACWLDSGIIVTASEDETVRIWKDHEVMIESKKSGLDDAMNKIDSPLCAVRAIQSFKLDSNSGSKDCFVLVGASGVVQCYSIEETTARLNIRLLAEHRPEICETRLLSVCVLSEEDKTSCPIIVTGGSDGFLTVFTLVVQQATEGEEDDVQEEDDDVDPEAVEIDSNNNIDLKKKKKKTKRKLPAGAKLRPALSTECSLVIQKRFGHGTRAVLSLVALNPQTIVSGETDGRIRVWDVATGDCRISIDAHAAGVNCMSAWVLPSNSHCVVLVSGGDDQAVATTRISFSSDDGTPTIRATTERLEGIAATAITGVVALSESMALAVGADQRLSKVCLDGPSDKEDDSLLILQSSVMVDVGDVTCLAVNASKTRAVVCGLGMQVLSL